MLDCLLVHCPKFQNRYPSLGNYTSLQLIALGIFGLGDYLTKQGNNVRILHLGIEKQLNPKFRIADYLNKNGAPLSVGFSCQFHQQLHDTLRAAKAVKASNPNIFVFIGGMTATFFSQDILNNFPYIDAIIRGDGEKPIAALLQTLRTDRNLANVENLTFRDGLNIVVNPQTYAVSQDDIQNIDYANMPLMENYEAYIRMPKIFTRLKAPLKFRKKLSKMLSQKSRITYFALPVGRGCVTNCAYCGGGVRAQKFISQRHKPIFRAPENVVETIEKLKSFGYQGAYVSFDPQPISVDYYKTLFSLIRQKHIDFDLTFASWSLPSRDFIDDFKETFSPYSAIYISPECGSERVRKLTRGLSFTNQQLLDTLAYMEDKGVKSTIFFSLGIPGETKEEFNETIKLQEEIKKQYSYSGVSCFPIEIEPASPWYLYPENFNITVTRRTLNDFIDEQTRPNYSSMHSLGYYPPQHHGQQIKNTNDFAKLIRKEKCKHFCSQRLLCAAAKSFWSVVNVCGMTNHHDEPI